MYSLCLNLRLTSYNVFDFMEVTLFMKDQCIFFKGTCICNEEYGAADCSIRLADPPIVNGVNLDTGGLCDKMHCSEAIVEGDLFLDRATLTCKMQRFDVNIWVWVFPNSLNL